MTKFKQYVYDALEQDCFHIVDLEGDVETLKDRVDDLEVEVRQLKKDLKYQQLHNQLVNNWFKKVERELNECRANKAVDKGEKRKASK